MNIIILLPFLGSFAYGQVTTSNLQANLCGTTLTSMSQSLVATTATTATGATAYTFRISGGALGSPLTFTSTNSWTSLSNFALDFSTTYSVDVAPTIGGSQQAFGTACNITTSAVPVSNLQPSLCGATVSSMFQSLVATSVSGATAYTFRISGGGLGSPLTVTSTNN
tara:strand:+ start:6412 stop:6912 length:501 start_codon:yes stop_codon:yes gene_type:complete